MKNIILLFTLIPVIITLIISVLSFDKILQQGNQKIKISFLACAILLLVTTGLQWVFINQQTEESEEILRIERQTSDKKIRQGIDSGLAVTLNSLSTNIEKSTLAVLLSEKAVKNLYKLQTITDSTNLLLSYNINQVSEVSTSNNQLFENMVSERRRHLELAHASLIQTVKIISALYDNIEYNLGYWRSSVNDQKVKELVFSILNLLKSELSNQHLVLNPNLLPNWNLTLKLVNKIFSDCNMYSYNQEMTVEHLRSITHYFTVFFVSYLQDHDETLAYDPSWKNYIGAYDSSWILKGIFQDKP